MNCRGRFEGSTGLVPGQVQIQNRAYGNLMVQLNILTIRNFRNGVDIFVVALVAICRSSLFSKKDLRITGEERVGALM